MFTRTNTDKFFTPIHMHTQNETQDISLPEVIWYCTRSRIHILISIETVVLVMCTCTKTGKTVEKIGEFQGGMFWFCFYFRNFDTSGDVSPCRMKCPDGPSPRNSLNYDSCYTCSSFRIAKDRSYVRWSLLEG